MQARVTRRSFLKGIGLLSASAALTACNQTGGGTQGMPLVDTSQGSSAIAFMNACGYQLMAVGNHEFDWAVENLDNMEKQANFPFLRGGEYPFSSNARQMTCLLVTPQGMFPDSQLSTHGRSG